jgi:hypothetical protein
MISDTAAARAHAPWQRGRARHRPGHRVSNPDRVTGGVARWPTPTEDSGRDIPKGRSGAVGSFHTRINFRTTPTRLKVESVASVVNLREQYLLGRRFSRPAWAAGFTGEPGSPPKEMGFG